MTNTEKTIKFLLEEFDKSEYYKNEQFKQEKQYRIDHTFRVANYAKEIAQKENLDVEAAVIGCLLHDLSYVKDFKTKEDWKNHGRSSAAMARDFIYSLRMDQNLKDEILYGIAIHVDDKSDFEGNRTPLAELIGECDNIDRFDTYRMYEYLKNSKLDQLTLLEQIELTDKRVQGLKKLKDYVFKTETSNKLWNEKLDYQIEYFTKLNNQLLRSKKETIL